MTLDASDALTQLVIFAGVIIGNMGATLIPYLQAKAKYGEYDIKILFDNKFLATAAASGLAAFILVSGSFNTFMSTVLSMPPTTYLAAFFAALGLGYTFNTLGNKLMPSPTNPEAAKDLEKSVAVKVLEKKGIDVERLNELLSSSKESHHQQHNEKEGEEGDRFNDDDDAITMSVVEEEEKNQKPPE